MAIERVASQTAVDKGPRTRTYADHDTAKYLVLSSVSPSSASLTQQCISSRPAVCLLPPGSVSPSRSCLPVALLPTPRCSPVQDTLRRPLRLRALGWHSGIDLDGCGGFDGRKERGRRDSRGGSTAATTRRSCRLDTLLAALIRLDRTVRYSQ